MILHRIYTRIALLVCVLIIYSQPGFAWGVTGHRVVAEIAQRHLTPKAKREIKKLLGDEPLAFWANWGDFIKSDTAWRRANKWHYVDFPGHISKAVFLKDLKALQGENLYTQVLAMKARVKDLQLPAADRQEALRFLIHLVADLHQPLHVGREEDQGGIKIAVTWFDRPLSLHTLWDEALVDFQQWSYTEYATVLDVATKEKVDRWQHSSLEDWLYESHQVSDKIYDLTKPDAKLSYSYNYIFVQDLNDQLLKGGLRLAQLLNEIFG
jgi:hypothetical protein